MKLFVTGILGQDAQGNVRSGLILIFSFLFLPLADITQYQNALLTVFNLHAIFITKYILPRPL